MPGLTTGLGKGLELIFIFRKLQLMRVLSKQNAGYNTMTASGF